MQSLTFIIFIVSEKIAMIELLPHMDNRPAGLLLIITLTHIIFSCESKPCTVLWMARLRRSCLSPEKATRISEGDVYMEE